jgi:hypothetical protein
MTKQLRLALGLVAVGMLLAAGAALAGSVKIGPVKGATYVGAVKGFDKLTIKVAPSGKTATASLPAAPAYCQGGSGPQVQHAHVGRISKGALTTTITYTSTGSSTPFATVTIKGSFYTFSGEKPVFQGTAKSTFEKAAECSGQESFQATKS